MLGCPAPAPTTSVFVEAVLWVQQHARGINLYYVVGRSLGKQCGCELE